MVVYDYAINSTCLRAAMTKAGKMKLYGNSMILNRAVHCGDWEW